MAPRLKVYCWSDGFHAFSVAASSRPGALKAWGIGRDIFREGLAREITAGPDHEAALAAPGTVIERGLVIDPGALGARRVRAPRKSSQAARRRLEALESDLEALDIAHERDRRSLESDLAALDAAHRKAHAALTRRVKAARAKAG